MRLATLVILAAVTIMPAACVANLGVSGSETPRDPGTVEEPEKFGLDNGTVGIMIVLPN